MAFVNFPARELYCKIVYYGPGLCGKTTNVEKLHAGAPTQSRGNLVSLKTESERTLFFDFLPLELGKLRGYRVRLHLYTVPGQIFYRASRKLILKGVDALVFVADSQRARREANIESLQDLHENLAELDLELREVPCVTLYVHADNIGDLLHLERHDAFRTIRQEIGLTVHDRLCHAFERVVTLFDRFNQPLRGVNFSLDEFTRGGIRAISQHLLIPLTDPQPWRVFVLEPN
ncbi:MAG TPA: gliding motility protein, partial [Polyangium sp.]|nr:gliding motility protein [Polyangium sp.]